MSDLASAIGMQVADMDLVAELQAGSEAAFAQLIALYSRPVYSLVACNLRDSADAADVTQEVFVKVFRNISSFCGDSSLRTWIYRIALHEASNQRRWWSRHKARDLALDASPSSDEADAPCLADQLASPEASPYDYAAQAQLRAQVAAAVATLPVPFREAIILREMEGFSYEEVAEVLQVSVGTVKSRLARGRAALRELLCAAHSPAHTPAHTLAHSPAHSPAGSSLHIATPLQPAAAASQPSSLHPTWKATV